MIEIVFGDSACGSLKAAQHYGVGEFDSEGVGMIIGRSDGYEPTEEQLAAAREEIVKRMRAEWEAAVALGGSALDIYGFSYNLSVGDVSENIPGRKRQSVLAWLYGVHPYFAEAPDYVEEIIQKGKISLSEICSRIASGESVRVWYSSQPDELCGMHWFLAQISKLNLLEGQVLLVALPENDMRDDGTIIPHSSWGEVKAGDWHRYVGLQKAVSKPFCLHCADVWERLRLENAPLRAVLNGRLVSVPETLYDWFISKEIDMEEDEFSEARIIGKVLYKYGLGIGDSWIARRIEVMVLAGYLTPTSTPAPNVPSYHRLLKRNLPRPMANAIEKENGNLHQSERHKAL